MQLQKTVELIVALAIVPFLTNPALAAPTILPVPHKPNPAPPAQQQQQEKTVDQLHQKLMQKQAKSPTVPPKPKEASSFVDGKMVLSKAPKKNGFHKGEPVVVVVDKSSHYTYVMALEKGDKVVEVLRASNAIGTEDTPTPYGPYKVTSKQKYPTWYPPKDIEKHGKPVPPYNKTHKNPLGVAQIRLNKFGIYMHGTNDPHSLRHNVSHGCIRHSNGDIMKIYNMVNPGTTVLIVKHFAGTTLTKAEFESEKDTSLKQHDKGESTGNQSDQSSRKAEDKHTPTQKHS